MQIISSDSERNEEIDMNQITKGKQSLLFENAPYIVSAASVTGSKEA